uniref:Uncharacterized protein n=1 Tax=Arundo donax TaxID=35708 RepID=A0A0A9GYZ7_ARUDO
MKSFSSIGTLLTMSSRPS